MSNLYKIHFMTEGEHTDANNSVEDYDLDYLQQIKNSYEPKLFESPIVIGHEEDLEAIYRNDKAPSFGWVKSLGIDEDGLYAIADLAPELSNLIERDVPPYRYVSSAIYEPDNPFNPVKGKAPYLRHIAFLGGQPPAIKGLPEVQGIKSYSEVFNKKYNRQLLNMKKYGEETGAIQIPSVDAPPEVIKNFFDNNSFDFLVYILTEGELGYAGDITRIEPEPTEENNYLFDVDKQKFLGVFYDDNGSEPDGYSFEIAKKGKDWTSSYIPVNQEEDEEALAAIKANEAELTEDGANVEPATYSDVVEEEVITQAEPAPDTPNTTEVDESIIPSDEQVIVSSEPESADLSLEDENSMANGELPEVTKEDADEEANVDLLIAETKALRQEVLKLKTELNEYKLNEYRSYCESKENLFAGTKFAGKLLEVFHSFDSGIKGVKAYSDDNGRKVPKIELLKDIFDALEEKFDRTSVVSYGEAAPIEKPNTEVEDDLSVVAPGAPADPETLKIHKEVLRYCAEKGLDPRDSNQYLKAYKAVI